jgi:hypothetical protein
MKFLIVVVVALTSTRTAQASCPDLARYEQHLDAQIAALRECQSQTCPQEGFGSKEGPCKCTAFKAAVEAAQTAVDTCRAQSSSGASNSSSGTSGGVISGEDMDQLTNAIGTLIGAGNNDAKNDAAERERMQDELDRANQRVEHLENEVERLREEAEHNAMIARLRATYNQAWYVPEPPPAETSGFFATSDCDLLTGEAARLFEGCRRSTRVSPVPALVVKGGCRNAGDVFVQMSLSGKFPIPNGSNQIVVSLDLMLTLVGFCVPETIWEDTRKSHPKPPMRWTGTTSAPGEPVGEPGYAQTVCYVDVDNCCAALAKEGKTCANHQPP